MMTQQARLLHPEGFPQTGSFRPYPSDSPEAKARLIILALLADGDINEHELLALNDPHLLTSLGISREGFTQVLHELCTDLARLPREGDTIAIAKPLLHNLFESIKQPEMQSMLLSMIGNLIQSDGQITRAELQYWKSAAHAWQQQNKACSSA